MVSVFDLSHLKDRYRKMITDRSVNLHASLAELLGTFIVVLIGTGAIQLGREVGASENPIVNATIFGLTYFVVMCAIRHHGAAHLNPAITIASMMAGLTGAIQAFVFITAQVLGAIIASAIVRGMTPDGLRDDALFGAHVYDEDNIFGNTKDRAFGAEIIATFVLTYIYLQVFSHPRSEHKMLGPLAVGLAYIALIAGSSQRDAGCLNPARALGPAAVADYGDDLWIWVIGPIVGALIAVPLHLISVTDLPELDKDGHIVRHSSAVDVAEPEPKGTAATAV